MRSSTARSVRFLLSILLVATVARGQEPIVPLRLPIVAPDAAGFDATHLARIDTLVEQGLVEGKMPGCVVGIGRAGKFVWKKAYGFRSLLPQKSDMTVDTVFDMASLTKPMATATSIMILVDQGLVRLGDTVATYIPEFAQSGKEEITVHDLLTHQSGLLPDNALEDYERGPDEAWRRIWALGLAAPSRTKFIYSDVNFETLGEIIRRVSGKDVHAFSYEHIFRPLEMQETGFLPPSHLRPRCVVTEQREGRWMQGEVHDPRAYLLGGVAGHAGLFSTVDDLALYATMMLRAGQGNTTRIVSRAAWENMTQAYEVPGGHQRGLGWDKRSGYSSNRGEWFRPSAFGHGGFTGTVMWIDPELDLFVIFLSNRVHPDGKGSVNRLAGRIGTIAVAALTRTAAQSSTAPVDSQPVLCGIDVLRRDEFEPLRDRQVGLITNHTGLAQDGSTTAELLHQSEVVHLRALFSPEHGIHGRLDTPRIGDDHDEATGLPVFSLYGESRRPSLESLSGIDTFVFDIQDVGCRFYTYVSTMRNAMQVAAEHNIRFVVLDRPNPINGVDVQGPVLDPGQESFVAFHTVPVRHGMTVGELARLFQVELNMEDLDLHVIKMEGWKRELYWDGTGLLWVNLSPNMRSVTQALLYPGMGLLETTNLSVGRGTDTPFQWIGAPWIDAVQLAFQLKHAQLPGVGFVPVKFTPASSKFANEACHGVEIIITDRRAFLPLDTGFLIASTLRRLYPNDWHVEPYMRLLGDQRVFDLVDQAAPLAAITAAYQEELSEFMSRREKVLLY